MVRISMVCVRWLSLSGALCAFSAAALEGSLAPAVKSQVESENYWMNYSGYPVKDYVRELNRLKSLKVGVDPKLSDIKTVPKFEFKDKNVVSATEVLATALNVKVFYLRDFLYIAKDLPPGLAATYAGDPPKADPKADPKKAPPKPAADAPPPVLTKLLAIFPGRAPGNSKVISWNRKGPDEVRQEERPVIMLIADGDEKNDNPAAWFYDTLLLEDPACIKALVDFTFVRITALDAAGWPATIVGKAKKGSAALLLLTCDGTAQQTWLDINPALTPQVIVTAAAQVAKQNEQMKGKLPALKPEEKVAEKKDDRKGLLPGLPPPKKKEGDEDEEEQKPGGKKPDEKKPDNPGRKAPPKNNGMSEPAEE